MHKEIENKPYIDEIQKLAADISLIRYIEENRNSEDFEEIVIYCCDIFLDGIQRMFLKYDKNFINMIKSYCKKC